MVYPSNSSKPKGPKPQLRYEIRIAATLGQKHMVTLKFYVDAKRIGFTELANRVAKLFSNPVPPGICSRIAKAQDKINKFDPTLKMWDKLSAMTDMKFDGLRKKEKPLKED